MHLASTVTVAISGRDYFRIGLKWLLVFHRRVLGDPNEQLTQTIKEDHPPLEIPVLPSCYVWFSCWVLGQLTLS